MLASLTKWQVEGGRLAFLAPRCIEPLTGPFSLQNRALVALLQEIRHDVLRGGILPERLRELLVARLLVASQHLLGDHGATHQLPLHAHDPGRIPRFGDLTLNMPFVAFAGRFTSSLSFQVALRMDCDTLSTCSRLAIDHAVLRPLLLLQEAHVIGRVKGLLQRFPQARRRLHLPAT